MKNILALIGLSGSGKSTVGPLLAQALGWRYLDIDAQIVVDTGQPINTFFAQHGENAFRDAEHQALAQALEHGNLVVATGGGIVERPENRDLLQSRALVVWLHAPVRTLASRLQTSADRPLLASDPVEALQRMTQRRASLYSDIAQWVVATEGLSPQQTVDEIIRRHRLHQSEVDSNAVLVTTPGGSYEILAGVGLLDTLPQQLKRLGLTGRLWLVSNTTIMPLHGDRVANQLHKAGYDVQTYAIPDGEQFKTLDTMTAVYDWLLGNGVERGDTVLALGGGVVGDLAGFAAASVLRGIAVVQLPTTVLAMVDSAIGGKTGIDHPVGKNLIGAFHQPRLVLADTALLATLPPGERAAGWAEAIKHGVIGDPALFLDLAEHAQAVLALQEPVTGQLIQRAAAYKARVVSGDEREQGGRIMLNYGHTIGHALEAESNYSIRHGEAIAIGMMAAGRIANRVGLFDSAALAQQKVVLERFGLPTNIPAGIRPAHIIARLGSDKKVRAKRIRWVLPTAIGATTVRDDIPMELVTEVVQELMLS